MKIRIACLFLICLGFLGYAQEDSLATKEHIKTGWNFGVLPVVAYNSDLGFQYGLIFSPFDYGDGTVYPNYKHKLYFEVSRYTKGSGIYHFYYNSKYLIPGINFIADLSYLPDEAYDFYGFNGNKTKYYADWVNPESTNYVSSLFYDSQRKMYKAKLDFQGKTAYKNFGWAAGILFRDVRFNRPDFAKINEGKDSINIIPNDSTLYDKYVGWGLINKDQKNGGKVTSLKIGMVYDTRDIEANPNKGVWTEASVSISPSFLGSTESFGRFNLTHRQYITLIKNKVTFAYRAVFQTKLFGETPFYIVPEVETSVLNAATNEGLGGSATLRGITRNRILGETVGFANLELRWKIVKFVVAKQNVYIGTNLFFDTGVIFEPIKMDLSQVSDVDKEMYFNLETDSKHNSAGLGLKLAMNENFIISIDKGYAFSSQDGINGTYIRMNYLF